MITHGWIKNRKSIVYELYSPMTLNERKSGN